MTLELIPAKEGWIHFSVLVCLIRGPMEISLRIRNFVLSKTLFVVCFRCSVTDSDIIFALVLSWCNYFNRSLTFWLKRSIHFSLVHSSSSLFFFLSLCWYHLPISVVDIHIFTKFQDLILGISWPLFILTFNFEKLARSLRELRSLKWLGIQL